MNFIGLDLAWGEVAWTGLAVVDDQGRLLVMERVRTDEEIVRAADQYLRGAVVAAIDAPLIVRNSTGRRPCEAQVSSLFGRFHAGAHSSNTSLPSFRHGPRGGRVATLLGLEVDPYFEPRDEGRHAIEVYPHPATITLFGLDRVLPYKAKPGRKPEDRQAAMLQLMAHIVSLAQVTPALDVSQSADWAAAEEAVARAATHAELNRWEDAIDAVLCAYIGMHRWWHGDAESAVLGDLESGYIVVPLDERVRRAVAVGPRPRLSNAEVEELAVKMVKRAAERDGRKVEDTRHVAGATGDLLVDGRPVEIKASAGSMRGEDVWLEPRQAEGLIAGRLDLVLVEHVSADGSGTLRRVEAETLLGLLPRLREHRYFTLPLPVATYETLHADVFESDQ